MNQFIAAWEFALKNFQYLFLLVLPVMVSEMLLVYLLIPVNGMTPLDLTEYLSDNSELSQSIMLASLVVIILIVSLTGGIMIAFQTVVSGKGPNPINALYAGFKKFFPLLGASILSFLLISLGFILLVLPGFYFMGRLYLFPAYIMLENKGVMDSLRSSWEATDEYGTKLFFLTFTFFVLTLVAAIPVQSIIFKGNLAAGIISAGLIEYIILLPWTYIYFSLYKSLKN